MDYDDSGDMVSIIGTDRHIISTIINIIYNNEQCDLSVCFFISLPITSVKRYLKLTTEPCYNEQQHFSLCFFVSLHITSILI